MAISFAADVGVGGEPSADFSGAGDADEERRFRSFGQPSRPRTELLSGRIGEGVNPPPSVGLVVVAKLNRVGVGHPDHGGRFESFADRKPLGQRLVGGLANQQGRWVLRHEARGKLGRGDVEVTQRCRIVEF